MYFLTCPRCGEQSYEKLKSHDHCCNCNYSSEFEEKLDMPIPPWAQKMVDDPKDGIARLIAEAEGSAGAIAKQSSPQEPASSPKTLDVA